MIEAAERFAGSGSRILRGAGWEIFQTVSGESGGEAQQAVQVHARTAASNCLLQTSRPAIRRRSITATAA